MPKRIRQKSTGSGAILVVLMTAMAVRSTEVCAAGRPVQLKGQVVRVPKVQTLRSSASASYHVAQAMAAPVIDGQGNEWTAVPAIVLDQKSQAAGPTPWSGPNDLSGALRLLWDAKGLYYFIEVTDDVVRNPDSGFRIWNNDSFQMIIDPHFNGPKGSYDATDLSFIGSNTPHGPALAQFRGPGMAGLSQVERVKEPGVQLKIVPRTNGFIYEGVIPWSLLPSVSPSLLGRCGLGFALGDNDQTEFKGGLQWTPGVYYGDDAGAFGELVFDGTTAAVVPQLELRPESQLLDSRVQSSSLPIPGVSPFDTATILLRADGTGKVAAGVTVTSNNSKKVVAMGTVEGSVAPGTVAALTWDLSGLPNGLYNISYTEPRLDTGRQGSRGGHLTYYRVDLRQARARKASLIQQFGIDRPWDDLATLPESTRRYRGIVALGLQWMANGIPQVRANPLNEDEASRALIEFANTLAALDGKRDYHANRRGRFWAAYYSGADGSGQPFAVGVPLAYNPGAAKRYPLIVRLHGGDWLPRSEPHPLNVDSAMREDAFIVEPWGRGFNTYRALGEDDIMQVITWMKRYYPVNADAVTVTGASMGGMGSWTMASRYPGVFAAAGPSSGFGYGNYLENLRNTVVFSQHGLDDWGVSVDTSRYSVNRMQQLGYSVLHKEYAATGHDISRVMYPVEDRLIAQRRDPRPRRLTLATDSEAIGRAAWLNIIYLDDPHRPARIQASINEPAVNQFVTLNIENVDLLWLVVDHMPVDASRPLTIQIGRIQHTIAAPLPADLFVQRSSKGTEINYSVSAGLPNLRITGRPYRNGAGANLYTGEPLLIVYGTRGTTEQTDMLHAAARSLARRTVPWNEMPGTGFPVRADTDVTTVDMRNFNLVLLGDAETNAIVKNLSPKLPISIDANYRLTAGLRTPVDLTGAGWRLHYYNPMAPRRLIFIVATGETGPAAAKWCGDANNIMGMSGENRVNQADLVVQSLTGAERRRMQFSNDWRWRERPGADVALPADRVTQLSESRARLQALHAAAKTDFAFWWGDDPNKQLYDATWFTLADAATAQKPEEILTGAMSGEELIALHATLLTKNELIVFPAFAPASLDPAKLYTVAMPPPVSRRLARREKNLTNVAAASVWYPQEMWAQLFKPGG